MEASEERETTRPEPLDAEDAERLLELEDDYEGLLLTVMALEAEWLLDNRIAYSLRQSS